MKIHTADLQINVDPLDPTIIVNVEILLKEVLGNKASMTRADFAEWFLSSYESALEVYNAIKLDER